MLPTDCSVSSVEGDWWISILVLVVSDGRISIFIVHAVPSGSAVVPIGCCIALFTNIWFSSSTELIS